jgi:tetratricopeptide (TPR) repeat protein
MSLLVLLAPIARAEDPLTVSLVHARNLLAANDAKAAFDLLAPLEAANTASAEFNYLYGIAALDAGEVSRAIFALERVLAMQPDNALARAEIGRAYLAAGETETARGELAQVRASRIPQAAIPAVDRLLGAITQLQSGQKPQVRGYLEAGFGDDSNINSATSDSQVAVPALGGLLVNLDTGSKKSHDTFGMVGGGASLRVPVAPDLAFAGNVAATQSSNSDSSRFDAGLIEGNAGLLKTSGDNIYSGVLQAATNRIGSRTFRNSLGVLGQWQVNLGSQAQLTTFVQAARLSYPGEALRDADRWLVGAGYAHARASGPVLYAAAYGGREAARASNVEQLSHDFWGLRGGIQWQSADAVTLFGNLSMESRGYRGEEPLFLRTRDDRQSSASLGLHYQLVPGWRLTPQVAWTSNRSNIAIYGFDRTVASIILRREF